jgi:hypothetical protein
MSVIQSVAEERLIILLMRFLIPLFEQYARAAIFAEEQINANYTGGKHSRV